MAEGSDGPEQVGVAPVPSEASSIAENPLNRWLEHAELDAKYGKPDWVLEDVTGALESGDSFSQEDTLRLFATAYQNKARGIEARSQALTGGQAQLAQASIKEAQERAKFFRSLLEEDLNPPLGSLPTTPQV